MSLNGRHRIYLFLAAVFGLAVTLYTPENAGARFLVDDAAPQQPAAQPQQNLPFQAAPAVQANDSTFPPDAVRNITAIFLPSERNGVQLTWDAPANSQDSYVVLRSGYALSTADMISNAVPIKLVQSDKLRLVLDRNLLPGRYFYAVLPKSKFDQRRYELFPGENYTTNPIIVASELSIGDSRTVASLKAVTIDERTVLLTWEPIGNFTGEYIVFRSHVPIDTQERFSNAEPVARLASSRARYLDSDAGPGRHYYAIACKTVDGVLYSDLKKDLNFTADPVFVGGVIGVKSIRAHNEGSTVTVTWKAGADTLNRGYYLIRTEMQPKGRDSIAGGYIVDSVQSAAEKYVERNVPAGRYFYILAPANYKDDEDFMLTKGVNVTDPALVIEGKKRKPAEKPAEKSEIDSDALPSGSAVPVTPIKPEISGPESKEQPEAANEDDILSKLVEIPLMAETKSVMETRLPEPIPVDTIPEKSIPGITIPVKPSDETASAAEPNQGEAAVIIPQPVREIDAQPIHSTAMKAPAKIEPEQKTQKIARTDRPRRSASGESSRPQAYQPGPPQQDTMNEKPAQAESGTVSSIVRRQFDRGNYKQTVTELSRILPSLQGKDAAKALYYIGRSCVELRRYRDAVGYFSDDDVRRYYPREADFWRDFSLERMR